MRGRVCHGHIGSSAASCSSALVHAVTVHCLCTRQCMVSGRGSAAPATYRHSVVARFLTSSDQPSSFVLQGDFVCCMQLPPLAWAAWLPATVSMLFCCTWGVESFWVLLSAAWQICRYWFCMSSILLGYRPHVDCVMTGGCLLGELLSSLCCQLQA